MLCCMFRPLPNAPVDEHVTQWRWFSLSQSGQTKKNTANGFK